MRGYMSRYKKEHYVKRDIRKDLYERFIKWCGGGGVNVCLEKALRVLEANVTPNIAPNVAPNIAGSASTEPSIAPNMAPNIAPNVTPNTPPPAPQESERRRSGHVWCEKKARIRSLQGFLKWVEKTYGLVDWWEEDDRYCFETLEQPRKERGKKKGPEEWEPEVEELE
jgi:hypothetical protein